MGTREKKSVPRSLFPVPRSLLPDDDLDVARGAGDGVGVRRLAVARGEDERIYAGLHAAKDVVGNKRRLSYAGILRDIPRRFLQKRLRRDWIRLALLGCAWPAVCYAPIPDTLLERHPVTSSRGTETSSICLSP